MKVTFLRLTVESICPNTGRPFDVEASIEIDTFNTSVASIDAIIYGLTYGDAGSLTDITGGGVYFDSIDHEFLFEDESKILSIKAI